MDLRATTVTPPVRSAADGTSLHERHLFPVAPQVPATKSIGRVIGNQRQVLVRLSEPARAALDDASMLSGSLGTTIMTALYDHQAQLRVALAGHHGSVNPGGRRRQSARLGPKRGTTLTVSGDEADQLAAFATEVGVSVSFLVERIIRTSLMEPGRQ